MIWLDDLWAAFQPIVNLTTAEVTGHEVLVRGPLGLPDEIKRHARGRGEDRELESTLRRLAVSARLRLPPGQQLFMNVDMHHEGMPLNPEGHPFDSRQLAIEISEQQEILGNAPALTMLRCWREAGHTIVLDDYGTGHGSLGTVIAVQPDIVKLDRYLVAGLDHDRQRRIAVEAVLRLAQDMGFMTIAEGVETVAEMRALQKIGVEYGQGFLLGRPERQPLRGLCQVVAAERGVRANVVQRERTSGDVELGAFHDALFEASRDAVYFVDKRRTILHWNRMAEEVTGYRPQDVVGRRCMDRILDHVDESGVPLCFGLCPLVHAMADGVTRHESIMLRNKAGLRERVAITAVPVWDDFGHVLGAIEMFRPVGAKVDADA